MWINVCVASEYTDLVWTFITMSHTRAVWLGVIPRHNTDLPFDEWRGWCCMDDVCRRRGWDWDEEPARDVERRDWRVAGATQDNWEGSRIEGERTLSSRNDSEAAGTETGRTVSRRRECFVAVLRLLHTLLFYNCFGIDKSFTVVTVLLWAQLSAIL